MVATLSKRKQPIESVAAPPRNRLLRRLYSDKLGFCSLCAVTAIMLVAVSAPIVAPADPYEIKLEQRLQSPSREHLMGTDEMGRDILSRVIYGSRISIGVALAVTTGGVVLGVTLGSIAGFAGGLVDELIMRVTDIFLAVPLLILAMAVAAALGPSIRNSAIAMILVWWPGYTRQARAEVRRIKTTTYVEAARVVGVGNPRLVLRHILPNAIDPILVRLTTTIGYVMLTMATLSFIGLGTRPPGTDWGTMVAKARNYLMSYPWYPLLVGMPLLLSVLMFALAGDAVQDALDIRIEGS